MAALLRRHHLYGPYRAMQEERLAAMINARTAQFIKGIKDCRVINLQIIYKNSPSDQ